MLFSTVMTLCNIIYYSKLKEAGQQQDTVSDVTR